jgi:lipid II:glycine glycyltransferase (peptidoglycan interpeptide bridge formation enzyme)
MVKKGLKQIDQGEVKVTYPQEISKEMLEVYQETEKRGGFVAYSDEFLKREWEVFGKAKKAGLICVWHKDRLLSWGMVIHTHSRAFYHQGANILDKNIPGSYLCQWHGILLARQKGAITYDFWGVAPEDKPNHPWVNISLFKRGFGGQDVEHLQAQDLVLNWRYWPNWVIETYRSYKRGFR